MAKCSERPLPEEIPFLGKVVKVDSLCWLARQRKCRVFSRVPETHIELADFSQFLEIQLLARLSGEVVLLIIVESTKETNR
jgi:hypothetical protein